MGPFSKLRMDSPPRFDNSPPPRMGEQTGARAVPARHPIRRCIALPETFPVMSHRLATFVLGSALLCVGASDAWAQGRGRGAPPRADDHTLSDSVRRIERDTRGEVLSAERVPFDGREMHRVKVLDDRGRVRVYMDDPRAHDAHRHDQDRRHQDRDERRRPARDDDD